MNVRHLTTALLSAAILAGCTGSGPLAPGNSSWSASANGVDQLQSEDGTDPVMPLPPAEPADPVHPILPIGDEDERNAGARAQRLDPVFPMPPIEDPVMPEPPIEDPVMPLPPAEPADPVHPILPIGNEDEGNVGARAQKLDPVFPMPPIEDPVMPLPPVQDDRPNDTGPR